MARKVNPERLIFTKLKKDLKKPIITRKLLPGDKLPSEHELARRYKISRPSVRKALAELERENLILKSPGKGSFVKQMRSAEAEKIPGIIGINMPTDLGRHSNIYPSHMINGIVEVFDRYDIRLELITNLENLSVWSDESKSRWILDGLIWISGSEEEIRKLSRLDGKPLPVVLVNRYCKNQNVSYVTTDHRSGSFKAVDYLVKLGHKKIGAIGGVIEPKLLRERLGGYFEALSRNGLVLDEDLVIEVEGSRDNVHAKIRHFLVEVSPTAIFVTDGVLAIDVLSVIYDAGLKVPEDISIVHFDDVEGVVPHPGPALTCVRQPLYILGIRAAETMLEIVKKGPTFSVKQVLPTELIIRESCQEIQRTSNFNERG